MISLSFGFSDRSGTGNYQIIRVLPAAENGQGQYRERGSEGHERPIEEHQIRAGVAEKNHFGNLE